MKKLLALFVILAFLVGGNAYATTKALQFDTLLAGLMDDEGNPLSGGTVYFYEAGTTTAKNVWTDIAETSPYTSVTLGSDGRTHVYGDGLYKVVVKKSDGTTYKTWDNVYIHATNYYFQAITGNLTATADHDFIMCNTNGGAITVTLPDISDGNITHPLTIKRNGSNNVVIDGDGAETIDGSATYTIGADKRYVQLVSDGTNWQISGTPIAVLTDTDGSTQIQTEATIIRFDIDGTEQVTIQDGKIEPTTDNDVDIGSSTKEFKDGYFDGTLYTDAINFNGTAITATAAEINTPLDGATTTLVEFQQLQNIDTTTISAAQWEALGSLTATASEINTPLDGATVSLTEFKELETIGDTTISANQWAALGGIAETLTATELNTLDGVAATLTYGELNILDGALLDVDELNTLNGITADVNELNILDGALLDVNELNILNGVTSTAVELNMLDGATAEPIQGNSTAGLTFRSTEVMIDDGGDANHITVTLSDATTGFNGANQTVTTNFTDGETEKHISADGGLYTITIASEALIHATGTFDASGSHDGTSVNATLVDSGENWVPDSLIGATVTNTTNSESCEITDNTETTITCTLSGAETWDFDDTYTISNVDFFFDKGRTWTTNAYVGATLNNYTDNSACTITSNTDETIICTLTGGTDNDWDHGDVGNITSDAVMVMGTVQQDDTGQCAHVRTWTSAGGISIQCYADGAGTSSPSDLGQAVDVDNGDINIKLLYLTNY